MWNKKKSKTAKTVNNKQNAPSVTFITKDTIIKADMFCNDDVRIAGTIDGEVESKQKLILSQTGSVTGSITSPEADVSGKINGDVRVSSKLTLRATAVIDGEIYAKKLSIEDGAKITGALKVGPEVDTTNKKKNGALKSGAPISPLKKTKSQ